MSPARPDDWLATTLRWLARGTSIFVIGMVSVFVIGEGVSAADLTPVTSVQMILFIAVCVGLLLAWRWEGTGGILSVASLLAFYIVNLAAKQTFPKGWAFVMMAVPGLFFVGSWLRARGVTSRLEPN